MRLNQAAGPHVRVDGQGAWRSVGELCLAPGQELCLSVQLGKGHPLECYLVGFWGQYAQEPWYLACDRPDLLGHEYGRRFWIECGFGCIKSRGFCWEKSRIQDPARMSRLWLAYAVSLLLVLSQGSRQEAKKAGKAPVRLRPSGCRVRRTSLFALGMAVVSKLIATGARLQCPRFARYNAVLPSRYDTS